MEHFTIPSNSNPAHLSEVPKILPILALSKVVMFPQTVIPLVVVDEQAARLLHDVSANNRLFGIFTLRDSRRPISIDNIHPIGTLVYLHRFARTGDNAVHAVVQGQIRLTLRTLLKSEPYLHGEVGIAREEPIDSLDLEGEALVRNLRELFTTFIELSTKVPEEVASKISAISDPRQLVYAVAASLTLDTEVAQQFLMMDSVKAKVERIIQLLHREIEVLEVGQRIRNRTHSEMERNQREYLLRQQIKAIQEELGEGDDERARAQEFRQKITEAEMPDEARREALRELQRFEQLTPQSPEYATIEHYLDWMTDLPWNTTSPDALDLNEARRILDADHYGLREVKERIVEYLAVRKLKQERSGALPSEPSSYLRPERKGAIICFVGPPGVGKTSLGMSIARCLGRRFIRQALGGMRDEAEIRGHRRTYVGAVPGRIIQSMRRAGTKNPVFMLDEIDKVGSDWRGDPGAALLEVLDPEQNRDFRDNYLNVPFDLSQVLFIATANIVETVPPALRDRMEIIELSGYTDLEKSRIAELYLVPRQRAENGLEPEEIEFLPDAILTIIQEYTREAGVRDLERQIGRVCRKVAVKVAQEEVRAVITTQRAHELLGRPRVFHEVAERTNMPGIAVGLAVTPSGGDILFIEATRMQGNKNFTVTGQLGDVMKESAQTAYSAVRARARELGIDSAIFEKSDVHVHVPAGAVPKDGPSAGIAITVAIASLFSGRPVVQELGMTGEVTLRGKVLPVGGIKEKTIAAHRAGLRTIIIPKHNEGDLEDLPDIVRTEMRIILADQIDQVFAVAIPPTSSRPHSESFDQIQPPAH